MLVAHRINSAQELSQVPGEYGIEIDLRDATDGNIIVSHDPFIGGERFVDLLSAYRHRFIILNIKSERIEWRVLETLAAFGIKDYFFLDSSFPMIHQLSLRGENQIAMRYSEFEGLDSIRLSRSKISWVWVDCFTRTPLTREAHAEIMALGLKVCLVSPELQGQPEKIDDHIAYFESQGIRPDMVCSKLKNLEKWQKIFS